MPGLGQVVGSIRVALARLLAPTPQSITLSVVRGGGLQFDVTGVPAGTTRTWRDTVAAPEDSVVVVLAWVSVEHGNLQSVLDPGPDTNVELTVSVDGARIGRSLVTLRQGAAEAITCTAAIRVEPGLRRATASLHPFDASVKVGDHTIVSLCVPETMASIGIG